MRVKTPVGLPYQFAVEALFAPAGFVSRHQQNCLAPGVKCKGHSLFSIRGAESQFLPVGVAGAMERVNAAGLTAGQTPATPGPMRESPGEHPGRVRRIQV